MQDVTWFTNNQETLIITMWYTYVISFLQSLFSKGGDVDITRNTRKVYQLNVPNLTPGKYHLFVKPTGGCDFEFCKKVVHYKLTVE